MNKYIAVSAVLFASSAQCAEYGPYSASVLRVIDGDSIEVSVRLWPGLAQTISLRLDGIDTPEKRGLPCEKLAAASAARFTANWLAAAGAELTVWDVRPDKYGGRILGRLTRPGGLDLGQSLVAAGHARPYRGGKRGAWCQ